MAVIGDEAAGGRPVRARTKSLRNPRTSPAGVFARCCSSRIWHLRLEIVVRRSAASRGALAGEGVGCAIARWISQPVADEDLAAVTKRELTHRLVLLLVGGDDRVADRQPLGSTSRHEPHPRPIRSSTRSSRRRRGRRTRSSARNRRSWRPIWVPSASRVPQIQLRRQRAQPPVVLRLVGKMQEPAQQAKPHLPEELTVGRHPHHRLGDRERDQLGVAHLCPSPRPPCRDRQQRREVIRCNHQGLQIRGHLEPPSRMTVTEPFSCPPRVLQCSPKITSSL